MKDKIIQIEKIAFGILTMIVISLKILKGQNPDNFIVYAAIVLAFDIIYFSAVDKKIEEEEIYNERIIK